MTIVKNSSNMLKATLNKDTKTMEKIINDTIIVQKRLKNFTNKKRNIYAKFLI